MKLFALLPVAMAFDPPASETGTLPAIVWPRLRHIVASNLAIDAGFTGSANATVGIAELFDNAMGAYPEDGNCWCYALKQFAPKGKVQDVYDEACNNFHKCLRCTEMNGETCDTSFTEVTLDYASLGIISGDSTAGSTTCTGSDECGNNICSCFNDLVSKFEAQLGSELPDDTYMDSCTVGSPGHGTGSNPTLECCGVAPAWKPFVTSTKKCCEGEIIEIDADCGPPPTLEEVCEELVNPVDTFIFEGSSETVTEGCINHGDLSFVIDVTGSMGSEISAISAGITQVADNGDIGAGAPFPRGNIVVYGDPSGFSRILTDDVDAFKADAAGVSLGNVIPGGASEGGGDCPEATYAGLRAAIDVIADCSQIYVITDADAVDFNQAVVDDAVAKRIKINFVLTRTCNSFTSSLPHLNVDPNYTAAADATGGTIYHMSKSNVGTELPEVVSTAALLGSGGSITETFTAGSNDVTLTGTNAITDMEITVNGNGAEIACVDDDGNPIPESEYTVLLDISTAKIVKVPRTSATGTILWTESLTCQTSATGDYSVSASGTFEGCDVTYCQNGGTCVENVECKLFDCTCASGFSGYLCQNSGVSGASAADRSIVGKLDILAPTKKVTDNLGVFSSEN